MAKTKVLPTVKVADGEGGFIVINEDDFDKKIHVLFDEKPPKKPTSTEKKPTEPKPATTKKEPEKPAGDAA